MSQPEDVPVQFMSSHARKLDDILQALKGQPELGSHGLVARLDKNEEQTAANTKQIESHGRIFWLVTVVGSGLWATLVAFKEQIFGHGK